MTQKEPKEEMTVFLNVERFTKLQAIGDMNRRLPDDIANVLLNRAIDNLGPDAWKNFAR